MKKQDAGHFILIACLLKCRRFFLILCLDFTKSPLYGVDTTKKNMFKSKKSNLFFCTSLFATLL